MNGSLPAARTTSASACRGAALDVHEQEPVHPVGVGRRGRRPLARVSRSASRTSAASTRIVTMTYLPSWEQRQRGSGHRRTITVTGGNEKFGYGVRVSASSRSRSSRRALSVAWVQRDLPTIVVQRHRRPQSGSIRAERCRAEQLRGEHLGVARHGVEELRHLRSVARARTGQVRRRPPRIAATVNGPRRYRHGGRQLLDEPDELLRRRVRQPVHLQARGRVRPGDRRQRPPTFNTFGTAAAASRSYFTLGLRFGR